MKKPLFRSDDETTVAKFRAFPNRNLRGVLFGVTREVSTVDHALIGFLTRLADEQVPADHAPVSYTHLTLPTIYSV